MQNAITIRPAEAEDAPAVARLIVMAGGGVYEFLLDGLVPGQDAATLLVPGVAARSGSFSHRHCTVAECGGSVVGLAHAYPADWMRDADRSFIPPDRLAHLALLDEGQDWGSYFLSALAVEPGQRRRGIARALLDRVMERAGEGGFDRVSLCMWADNADARRLYDACGFATLGVAAVGWHPRLPHTGGSVLMGKRV